ncbi:MAG: 4-hydroxy-tetrahydrodipicolinate synthase [Frankiales bacterium]|nr:4-hydroxy-tetrahydrodipicolinate synthase [Frankiales bacterium]
MTTPPFGRVLTAMVTPLHSDGSMDYERAAELADRLVNEGNDGLVLSGTTGEAPTTHRDEKTDLVRAVVDAVGGRAHVLAGVGSNDTAHAISMARDAEKAGAQGLLSVTPYYSKPPQAGIIAHTAAIAESTDLPVMLYDVPHRTGLAMTHGTIAELARHPQITALKDAKDDLAATTRVLAETDLAVYCGSDALFLPALSLGAVGIVSVVSHIVTPRLVELVNAYLAGDVARAAAINLSLEPVYTGLFRTQGVILTKAALALLGFPVGPVRLPLVDATADEVAALKADLVAGGVLS